MKILVIGLEGAASDILFGDERLDNVRRLMDVGCYGRLESVIPADSVPGWACLAASQDPGSLGIYGQRNRADHSYAPAQTVSSRLLRQPAIWDQAAQQGGQVILLGVPPSAPPLQVNGVCVGCFLTPASRTVEYTYPASVAAEIADLAGDYMTDVKPLRRGWEDRFKDDVYSMSRQHFQVARRLLQNGPWQYFELVDIGLDRLQDAFWRDKDAIREFYAYLDEEVGSILELLDNETAVLLVSTHGAQDTAGGFCPNEWLLREGLLTLSTYPRQVTPSEALPVDWEHTKVWADGGQLFFNVKGREPRGTVLSEEYEALRDDVARRLSAELRSDVASGASIVAKPGDIYKQLLNVAPDLIVNASAAGLSIFDAVGYGRIRLTAADSGMSACSHSGAGSFILASANSPLHGEVKGAGLLDAAPTLLELAGYSIPASMQGRSLVAGLSAPEAAYSADEEELIRQRLEGLGYIE